MPMTTTNTPHLREQRAPMADSKSAPKAAEPKADPKPTAAKARDLAPAGQSGDPDVQKLLAEREGHRLTLEPDDPEVQRRRDEAQAAIDRIDEQLAELGYTAK